MATNRLSEAESENVGQLVKGIVADVEKLAQQHIELFKKDMRDDLKKLKEGTFSLGLGLGVGLIGALLLGLALSNLILLLFPAPLDHWRWAAYGIIGILITGASAFMLYQGGKEVEKATPVAEKTMEALEDDVKWLKQPK
jgi:uncharacterized membrane protein YqjE